MPSPREMQSPRGCEREHLDQSPRFAEPPRTIVDLDILDANREAPEQVDRDFYRLRSQSRSSVCRNGPCASPASSLRSSPIVP